MSTEPDDTTLAPPAGEQIHLPEPSLLPILNAVGLSIAIIGIPISLILVIPGLVLFLVHRRGLDRQDAARDGRAPARPLGRALVLRGSS